MSNEPPDINELTRRHRGLAVLKALQREISETANEYVMRDWLERLALGSVTRDALRTDLEQLAGLGLIETEWRGFEGDA